MQVYAMVSVYLLSGCEAVHGKNVGLFLGGYLNEIDWTKQNCNLCCALQFYVGFNEVRQISGSQVFGKLNWSCIFLMSCY